MFLKLGNVTINTENIGYIELKEEEFYVVYKHKASIKRVKLDMHQELKDTSVKFFSQYNFYNINGYYINPNNITFMEENAVVTSKSSLVEVSMYFKDGMYLELSIVQGRWRVWKDTRLKTSLTGK